MWRLFLRATAVFIGVIAVASFMPLPAQKVEVSPLQGQLLYGGYPYLNASANAINSTPTDISILSASIDARFAGMLSHVRWLIANQPRPSSGGGGGGVSQVLFDKQVESLSDDISDNIAALRKSLEATASFSNSTLTLPVFNGPIGSNLILGPHFVSGDGDNEGLSVDGSGNIRLTAGLKDTSGDMGNNGQVLLSTATGINWVSTSTLGISGTLGNDMVTPDYVHSTGKVDEECLTYEATGNTWEWQTCGAGGLATTSINSSAKLASIITDETGNGALVFAGSPTLTGTLTAAAANFSGSVGIGTTTPQTKLHIVDNINNATNGGEGLLIENTNPGSSAYASLALRNNTGNTATIWFASSNNGDYEPNVLDINNDAGATTFTSGGYEYMRVAANGNIGIGSTTPTQKLTVAGTVDASGHAHIGNYGGVNNEPWDWGRVDTTLNVEEHYVGDPTITSPYGSLGINSLLRYEPTVNTSGYVYGVASAVSGEGSHNIAGLVGLSSLAYNYTTGVVDKIIGLEASANQSSGANANNMYGVAARVGIDTPGSTVVNAYGLNIQPTLNTAGAGAISHLYGVFINDQSVANATDAFNLYSAGANSKNYFAGNVGIGTTTPQASLHVSGVGAGNFNGLQSLSAFQTTDGDTWNMVLLNDVAGPTKGVGLFVGNDGVLSLNGTSFDAPLMSWAPSLTDYGTTTAQGDFRILSQTGNPVFNANSYSGNIGIGSSSPNSLLTIVGTSLPTHGNAGIIWGEQTNSQEYHSATFTSLPSPAGWTPYANINNQFTVNGAGDNSDVNNTRNVMLITGAINNPGENSYTNGSFLTRFAATSGDTSGSSAIAVNGMVQNTAVGSVWSVAGGYFGVENYGTTTLTGVTGSTYNTGFATSTTGVAAVMQNYGGRIGDAYGFTVGDLYNTNTIATTTGLYIGNLSSGTQTNKPYAIYSKDSNARTYLAGNVGIGTSNPQYTLDIRDAAGSPLQFGKVPGENAETFGVCGNAGKAPCFGYTASSTFNQMAMEFDNGGANITMGGNADGTGISFWGDFESPWTAGADLTIAASGNTGIGTTTPWKKLAVSGDLALTGRIYDSLANAGANGMVLLSTGSATKWVATSTLNVGGSAGFTNSAQLAALLSDETGTGAAVFATSPTLSGTLTMNGSVNVNSPTGGINFMGTRYFTASTTLLQIAIGQNAGISASNAFNSNFIGTAAGFQAVNAYNSNFLTNQSGYQATNAHDSNFLGNRAGYIATNASSSNFFGNNAGYQASSSSEANFFGYKSGYLAVHANNSNFLGSFSGYQATNAARAIFIGNNAGINDTVNNAAAGKTSIAIGDYSGTGGFSNSIAIGHGVINSATSQLNLGNVIYATGIYGSDTQSATPNSGKIGIGTSTPVYKLDVNGAIAQRALATNSTINYLNANASNQQSTTDLNPGVLLFRGAAATTAFGMDLGYSAARANYNTRIFAPSFADISFAQTNGFVDPTSQSSFTERMVIKSGGNVGIGTTTPRGILDVWGGTAAAATAGTDINLTAQAAGTGAGNNGGSINLFTGAGAGGWAFGSANIDLGDTNPGTLFVKKRWASGYSTAMTGVALGDIVTMQLSNSWSNTGNTALTGYSVRNSSTIEQDAYFGTVSVAGGSTYSPAFVWGQMTNASNDYAERMRLTSGGNLGIGTTTPAQKLQVVGNIRVGTSGSNGCLENYGGGVIGGTCSSDAGLKENIKPLAEEGRSYIESLAALTPVTYNWNTEAARRYSKDTRIENIGLIAQDVETQFPELVSQNQDGYRQIDFTGLQFYVIQAIKELWAKVQGHDARLEQLEKENQTLKDRLSTVEDRLNIAPPAPDVTPASDQGTTTTPVISDLPPTTAMIPPDASSSPSN